MRLARSESGLREGQAARVDLARLLDGVVSLFQPMADERGVALGLGPLEPLEIQGEQRRIFDRFYRVSPDREVPGSGLGLAIAREIAVAHGGSIELESEVGRGSCFRVRLPRLEAAARDDPRPSGWPRAGGPRKPTPPPRPAWYIHAAAAERPGSPTRRGS